jgi:hypothetical protein
VSRASTGLCGGRRATVVPTATRAETHLGALQRLDTIVEAAECAGHVQQLGSESLLPNLMEVKG